MGPVGPILWLSGAWVKPMSKRKIIHVDMDAFFAAIEILRHPEYRGKPVIVGGRGEPLKRGVVSAASYEARKFGVRSGMPLSRAYRNCPRAIFLPVDFKKYVEVSLEMKTILKKFTPLVESLGLDEASLDVSEFGADPETIAKKIKKEIREKLGLTASVGIAPNKMLAKLASDLNKPDGLTVIREGDVKKVLAPLPVRKLFGVGPKTEARLKEMDITTIGQLAITSSHKLIQVFGETYGNLLYNFSRGLDDSPVTPFHEPKSFGRETTFEKDTDSLGQVKAVLLRFARFLFQELNNYQYRAKTVTLKIRFSDFSTHTKAYTLQEPASSIKIIFDAAVKLLEQFSIDKKVRLVGLRLSNLEKQDERVTNES